MARVTVEDCVIRIPNRFDLVMLAAQRARDISAGAQLTMDRDNDKDPVVALREIADETVDLDDLEESLVKRLQKHVERDEPGEDEMDIAAIQQDMGIVVSGELPGADDSDDSEDGLEAAGETGELSAAVVFEDFAPDETESDKD